MIKGAQNCPVSVDSTPWGGRPTNFSIEQATKAQRSSRGIALLFFLNSALDGWVVKATPRPLYAQETPGTHCIGGWVGPSAGLNECGKSRSPPEFDSQNVQPVACSYTDYAVPAHGRPTNRSSIPGRDKKFSLLWCIQTYSWGPPSQSNADSGSPSRRVKEIGTWCWSLAPSSVEFKSRSCTSISSYDFTTCKEHHVLTWR